jgi:hypothetical protein
MRQKTIREAVVVGTLGLFLLTSAPAAARSASSAPRPVQASGWNLFRFESWVSTWMERVVERSVRSVAGHQDKAAPALPSVSGESSSATTDRSAAIDPLGFK